MDSVIEDLAKELKEKAVIGVIDIQERDLFRRFGVRGIPCFLIYRDGKLEERFSGGVPKNELRSRILQYAVTKAGESG